MNNAKIIMKLRWELLKAGKIQQISTFTEPEPIDMKLRTTPWPEPMHTVLSWKNKGRKVKEGSSGFPAMLWMMSKDGFYKKEVTLYPRSQTEAIGGNEHVSSCE